MRSLRRTKRRTVFLFGCRSGTVFVPERSFSAIAAILGVVSFAACVGSVGAVAGCRARIGFAGPVEFCVKSYGRCRCFLPIFAPELVPEGIFRPRRMKREPGATPGQSRCCEAPFDFSVRSFRHWLPHGPGRRRERESVRRPAVHQRPFFARGLSGDGAKTFDFQFCKKKDRPEAEERRCTVRVRRLFRKRVPVRPPYLGPE